MTRLYFYCSFATLLACSACSPSGPSTSPKATTAAGSSGSATVSSPSPAEARVVAGQTPAPEVAIPVLKPEYSDKAAFLAHLEATRPTQAIVLDGQNVWKGFGPAISYRTNGNGSISH